MVIHYTNTIIMSFLLARRRVFSGLKGVKVVQMVIPSRWNSCCGDLAVGWCGLLHY